jgi:hypothetical protein
LTADADITVLLGAIPSDNFGACLERHGFTLRAPNESFVEATRVLPVVHDASGFPADIVLGGPGLEEAFLARATLHRLHGLAVPVATAEDLVVMKVLAGRRKDEEDIVAILSAQRGLDLKLIRETLRELSEALAQDDLLPNFERLLLEASD